MSERGGGDKEQSEGLPRLPPGRHGLPREFVLKNQRDRIFAGMLQVVAELGYHDTTISEIADAAGLSRRTFYGFYKSKEDGFFATYEAIAEFLFAGIAAAGKGEGDWARQVRAELNVLLESFAANADLARFCLIAPPAAGGEIAAAYRAFLHRLLATLTAGRPRNIRKPSQAAEHGLIGGLAALLADKVEAGEGSQLVELLPDLVELVLAPYLGRERAIEEARRT